MTRARDSFARALAGALAAPRDGPLGARFPAALVTAIAASAEPGGEARLEQALAATIRALAALGVPAGRQLVLLAAGCPDARALRARLRASLAVPVVEHDPGGACFVAGRTAAGVPLEFSDELREAEALVVVGPASGTDGTRGGPFILCPGLASARTAAAWAACLAEGGHAAALEFAREAERTVPVQLALLWDARGRVVAGGGRERFEGLAATGRFPRPARAARSSGAGAGMPERH